MLAFCIGSTTVARLLERNFGNTLLVALAVDSARVNALEDEHFNMVKAIRRVVQFSPFARQKVQSRARLVPKNRRLRYRVNT
jgi:hypothetical protein